MLCDTPADAGQRSVKSRICRRRRLGQLALDVFAHGLDLVVERGLQARTSPLRKSLGATVPLGQRAVDDLRDHFFSTIDGRNRRALFLAEDARLAVGRSPAGLVLGVEA